MDARLATALDMDLAAAFDVTNLLFPVRARFITYPSDGNLRLAYALHMARSTCIHMWKTGALTAACLVSMIRHFR
jgi:hypothetical protein